MRVRYFAEVTDTLQYFRESSPQAVNNPLRASMMHTYKETAACSFFQITWKLPDNSHA